MPADIDARRLAIECSAYHWLGRFDAPSLWEVRADSLVSTMRGRVEAAAAGWAVVHDTAAAGVYATRDEACDALCRMVGITPFPNEPSWRER